MSEPYIRLKNICKSFGTVQANKNVSIDVSKRSEEHTSELQSH